MATTQRVNSNMDTRHIDVGGDVRLGSISYAYIDGTHACWLPRGEVWSTWPDFEYEPLRAGDDRRCQQELTLRLPRLSVT
jgi:hypothetical protein